MICLMRASSTTFMPISGSTTVRSASRMASSLARAMGSKAGASGAAGGGAAWAPVSGLVAVWSVMVANPSTRVGIDPREAGRSARSRLGDRRHDHAHELAQVLRQVRGVGGREAGAIKGAIGGEEVGVAGAVAGGVAEGLGDADLLQLRVLDLDLAPVEAVGTHLEQVAHGEAAAVAEGLAVHDQRVRLDPLDGHAQTTVSSRIPAPFQMKRATLFPLWSPGMARWSRRRLSQASTSTPRAWPSSGVSTATAAWRRAISSVAESLTGTCRRR